MTSASAAAQPRRHGAAARFAWAVLVYNIAVVLWGAYVRATGSGAGCGSHWPLCNGVIVQRGASTATLIEYSHRITSGLALLSVVALLVWTWRTTPTGHAARKGAAWSVFFMITEAAVGAGLVLFQLVANDASAARAMFMGVHLLNTFVLLACISLTAWWLTGTGPDGEGPRQPRAAVATWAMALGGCAAILLTSSSGAVAALGDTLFPNRTLAEALQADLAPASHALIRLRLLHPFFAGMTALLVWYAASRLARGAGPAAAALRTAVMTAVVLQVTAGVLNVVLLAPVWLQLLHLLAADAVWIAFVLLCAAAVMPENRQKDREHALRPGRAWTSS